MSLAEKLAAERRGRLAAERLLELKQAELYSANRKLGLHARALSEQIVEQKAEVENVRDENRRVRSDLTVAHQKVEVAERRLWHSLASIQDGFAFFDSDDKMVSANESYLVVFDGLEEVRPGVAYARILQLLTEEGIVDTEGLDPPDWRGLMLRRRQMANPEPVTIRLWNDQFIKVMDHRSSAGDVISLGLNITSTVQYEHELKEARIHAEEAARAKSAFLANMSHEIRTPMNGVVGMAELLSDSDLNDEQSLYVDTIRNSGEALLVIINDILDFSKIEAEKLVLHNTPFDLERAILEVIMLVQPTAREKGLSLLLDYDLFMAQNFKGDVGRIRQILTNLIGNAVKFTQNGHVLVRITGVPDNDNSRTSIHIAIEDTGIGIPEDKINHIFGEFTQVDDEQNREFEGTGLGLAISQKLVRMMEGEMWATSELGAGSCFGFRILLETLETAPISPPKLPSVLSRIMVLDGSEANRGIIRRQIELSGVAAEGFPSGKDGLMHLSQGYDLIIVDHFLHDMEGVEFVAAVRSTGNKTPIVMISANPGALANSEMRDELYSILQRPLSRDSLSNVLSELAAAPKYAPMRPEANDGIIEGTVPDVLFEPIYSKRTDMSGCAYTVQECEAHPSSEDPVISAKKTETTELPPTGSLPTKPEIVTQAAPKVERVKKKVKQATLTPPVESVLRTMKILAAEDNKTNQLVFRKMVKALDIELTFANDGIEAVEAFRDLQPDLVFMDISMPRMDGKEATKMIREMETKSGKHTPIVALTAHAMSGDDTTILEAGLDHYLTKPLRKPAIHDIILQNTPNGVRLPLQVDDIAS